MKYLMWAMFGALLLILNLAANAQDLNKFLEEIRQTQNFVKELPVMQPSVSGIQGNYLNSVDRRPEQNTVEPSLQALLTRASTVLSELSEVRLEIIGNNSNPPEERMMADNKIQRPKTPLIVTPTKNLEFKYVSTFPSISISSERIDCMSGVAADRRIPFEGAKLDPAKLCMAWLEKATIHEVSNQGFGIMVPYIELASSKRLPGTAADGVDTLARVLFIINQ